MYSPLLQFGLRHILSFELPSGPRAHAQRISKAGTWTVENFNFCDDIFVL